MDQNNPARFLDTAYNALKANPGATNQILQAAAQGAPVGLRGLAAAAAQQSQQEAQKSMAALQQQGPQPNIVQKLATQGIMSQMDTGLPIAPQMGAPEQMPQQMMATGGLVSFADGGNVLPPDVIDAIQSHFAEGGDVRGFPVGGPVEMEDDILRKIFSGGREPKHLEQSERMRELFSQNEDDILRRVLDSEERAKAAAEETARAKNIAATRTVSLEPDFGPVPNENLSFVQGRSGVSYDPHSGGFKTPFSKLSGPTTESLADEYSALNDAISRGRSGAPMIEGLSKAAASKPNIGLTGLSYSRAGEEANVLDELIRRSRSGAPMIEGLSEAAAPKPGIGLTGPSYSAVQDESTRLAELLRKRRAAAPMLEGLSKAANSPPVEVPTQTVSDMAAKLAESAKPKLVGISPADAAAEMERLTPKQGKWTSGAADEAFNFGRLSGLAGKLPEGVKATGRLLGKVAPYSAAFDPRIMALVKANVGGAKMAGEELAKLTGGTSEDGTLRKWLLEHGAPDLTPSSGAEDVLGGLASLKSSDVNVQPLDWLAEHGVGYSIKKSRDRWDKAEQELNETIRQLNLQENYAYGGEVRGYAGGDLIKSLTGQSESPGIGLLKRAADFFTPDVNEAISREDFDASRAASAQKEKDMATLDQLLENYPRESAPKQSIAKPVTWKPEPHDGHEVVPRQRVIEEGTKVDPKFEQVKKDVPSAAVTPASATSGLNALAPGMDMEKMRDLIMGLGGHKELSPELSQQLGELKDSARTSTIIQSILGGLGGGLTDPYGGRFALGRAALGALGGYQKGIGSEEEIGRKAFDILRGYADAPAEEQTKARDLLFGQLSKSAELESEERRSALRAGSGLSLEDRIELAKVKAGLGPSPYQQTQITAAQQLARDRASDNAMREIEDINKSRRANVQPELTEPEKRAIIDRHFAMQGVPYIGGLGAQQSAGQSGGLGGGPLVLK